MVSKIFPADELSARTELFASRVAELPTMTARAIMDSVNQSVDAMGFTTALDASFTIHQLNHAHWAVESGGGSIVGTPALGLSEHLVDAPIRPSLLREV